MDAHKFIELKENKLLARTPKVPPALSRAVGVGKAHGLGS
jgi:hypothetical protein